MYGSQLISPPDPTYGTNVSYVNANYFGTLELVAAEITAGFDIENLEQGITIFPNPATDKLIIESESLISKITLKDSKGIIHYLAKNPVKTHFLMFPK
ncbi:MAG: hypothetical protein H7329_04050 [Opitutaceae bacterium]|nr:hypothetical protein [Cytophagales bacterium]